MSRASWSRVRSILEEALEQGEAERAAFVERACGEDHVLRAEVEELLTLEHRAPAFELLFHPIPVSPTVQSAETIGPYRIERSLGVGGMGEVYLARRTGPGFEQLVALKLVKLGMDTRELLARFDRERVVLASLRHDAIARLIDAGATESGRPYLVMEYVEGEPIDRWCDERRASVRERVSLVRLVCEAVQHAHQRLVLHRDLKPGNILVTSDGRPKLLDFGLAKLLPQEGDEGRDDTLTGQRLLTPAYASPEQLRGETVGVASDVYSLAIVLYELLAGERPFDSRRALVPMQDEQPERPSTRVRGKTRVAALRRSQPQRLKSELSGDLDTILLKALHPDAALRYPSIEAFSRDLGRYLEGLPVEARPDTWSYRAAKFVRRNRIAVGAAGIVLVALVGSGWWALRSYRQVVASEKIAGEQLNLANERSDRIVARESELRRLAVRLMTEVNDSLQRLQGATGPREAILNLSLETLQSFFSSENATADELLDGATAFLQLARVQGNGPGPNRGASESASESLCRALELANRALELDPRLLRVHSVLSEVHGECASSAFLRGEYTGALDEIDRSIEEAFHGGSSVDAGKWLCVRANAASKRGEIAMEQRSYDEALPALTEAESLAAEWSVLDPGEDSFGVSCRANDDLARVYRGLGETNLALEYGDRALELMSALSSLRPGDTSLALDHGLALIRGSMLRCDLRLYDEAIALAREATEITSRLIDLDPGNVEPQRDSADAWTQLGAATLLGADPADALEPLENALQRFESLALLLPGDLMVQRQYFIAEQYMGSTLLWNGRLEEGLATFAEAVERCEAIAQTVEDPLQYEMDAMGIKVNLIRGLEELVFGPDGAVRDVAAYLACEANCQEVLEEVERLGGEEQLPLLMRRGLPYVHSTQERCRGAKVPDH
jgi:serine/threonine protein kinase/tetratricopeptide (TPR) repeat protein